MEMAHKMKAVSWLELSYICCGCKEKGFRLGFKCEDCNYIVHKACKFPHNTISHEFFPNSTFKFFATPTPNSHGTTCEACTRPINGFAYHCQNQNLSLHPNCMELRKIFELSDGVFNLDKKVRGKCRWCEKNGSNRNNNGWSYESVCESIHVACLPELVAWIQCKEASRRQVMDSASASGNGEFELLSQAALFKRKGWRFVE